MEKYECRFDVEVNDELHFIQSNRFRWTTDRWTSDMFGETMKLSMKKSFMLGAHGGIVLKHRKEHVLPFLSYLNVFCACP